MSIQGGQPKKPRPKRVYERKYLNVNFKAPAEFVALCTREDMLPAELVRQFIADLCDLRAWTTTSAFAGSGPTAHRAAQAWLTIARQARQNKPEKRAAGADVPTPQPAAETRPVTPIEALAAAVARDQKKSQP